MYTGEALNGVDEYLPAISSLCAMSNASKYDFLKWDSIAISLDLNAAVKHLAYSTARCAHIVLFSRGHFCRANLFPLT